MTEIEGGNCKALFGGKSLTFNTMAVARCYLIQISF